MDLKDLIDLVDDFDSKEPREKIRLFAWFLHAHRKKETFDNAAIRACFREIHALDPGVSVYLPRMADRRPRDLVRHGGGYKLEGGIRRALDAAYGAHESVVAVTRLLSDLPARLPNAYERTFLIETLDCYKVRAYRAAIVMTWNLGFYHLLRWILDDANRLASFNAAIPTRFPKKVFVRISRLDDFEQFKESETIDLCRVANLFSKNVVEILRDKLKRRNMAAHPSQVVITQSQADDMITDLVNNVVLALH